MKKSILIICPDYHCSFSYRDQLRKMGWKADIYVPPGYPELMIYDQPDYKFKSITAPRLIQKIYLLAWRILFFLFVVLRYRYHFYYAGIDYFNFGEQRIPFLRKRMPEFRLSLTLSKMLGRVIIHLPSGFPDEEMPDVVRKSGDDDVNTATKDPVQMRVWFQMVRKYVDFNIGRGLLDTSQYKATHIKYKVIDLEKFNPNICIPKELQLEGNGKFRILHSFMFSKEREQKFKGNIKGSKYIVEAVDRLVREGYPIEFLYYDRVPANQFKFIQAQASIVVEELIRGDWGSTAVESVALGKPVITFVRKEWKQFYYRCFPETKPLPFIIANKNTIYEVLKKVITNKQFRLLKSRHSRRWAELHLDPKINVKKFAEILEGY